MLACVFVCPGSLGLVFRCVRCCGVLCSDVPDVCDVVCSDVLSFCDVVCSDVSGVCDVLCSDEGRPSLFKLFITCPTVVQVRPNPNAKNDAPMSTRGQYGVALDQTKNSIVIIIIIIK